MKRSLFLLVAAALSAPLWASPPHDGPYVLPAADRTWVATSWTEETPSQPRVDRRPVAIGDHITVEAVGAVPAFRVALRPPAAVEPDESVAPIGEPVFLLADTHGELEIAVALLRNQGVIDERLDWKFGRGRLVILGDVFDRGPNHTELLWLFYKLEAEAEAAGGRVHLILGNHEALVLTGDLRYLHAKYLRSADILRTSDYSQLFAKDTLLGQWLRTKPTVFKLGRVLCLHGGMSVGTVNDRWTLAELNAIVREWLHSEKSEKSARLAFVSGRNGPLWYRGYFPKYSDGEQTAREVLAVRKFYDVDRLAVGHTVVESVAVLHDGAVIGVQVYPTRDALTGKMTMEAVYIDAAGIWHRADVNGRREILRSADGQQIEGW